MTDDDHRSWSGWWIVAADVLVTLPIYFWLSSHPELANIVLVAGVLLLPVFLLSAAAWRNRK